MKVNVNLMKEFTCPEIFRIDFIFRRIIYVYYETNSTITSALIAKKLDSQVLTQKLFIKRIIVHFYKITFQPRLRVHNVLLELVSAPTFRTQIKLTDIRKLYS